MSDNDNIVDLGSARHRKDHERKEQKVEQMRDRFSKALGLESKPVKKGGLWKLKQKKKDKNKPKGPSGW